MSTSVEDSKETNGPEKLDEVREVDHPTGDAVADGGVVESKKGLFGRSAEFLKSPESKTMDAVDSNGHNGVANVNMADGEEHLNTSEGEKISASGDNKEIEMQEEEAPSLAEELKACVAEAEDSGATSIVVSYTKTVTVTEEEVVEEVKDKDTERDPDLKEEETSGDDVKDAEQESGIDATTDAVSGEEVQDESGVAEAEKTSDSITKKGKRTREKVVKEEEPMNERRRSLRTPKPQAVTTPAKTGTDKSAKKTPSKVDKGAVETPGRSGGRKKEENLPEVSPSKKVLEPKPTSARKGRSADTEKKKSEQGSDADDPFNLSNIDNHPDILSKIQIQHAPFGSMKFTKASPGTSHGRYEKTEQTAGERRSNLADMAPSQSTPRKSLTELSSTAPRQRHESATKAKRGLSSKVAKEPEKQEEEPMETDETVTPKSGRRGRSSTKTPQTAKKVESARKRAGSTSATPVSAKQKKVDPEIPKLNTEEQYEVDHRENEHVPYKIGARIYALWDREYYPAVVTADFDAAGRYGVTFVQDQVFRKLVITGIIPLQSLVEGVKVYATDPDVPEKEGRLEEVVVVASPSMSDREKWAEGVFKVKASESGKEFEVSWDKLCIGMEEAKPLRTAKVNSVTDVVADNIDSKEGRQTRASRHSFAMEVVPSPNVTKSARKKKTSTHIDEKKAETPATVEIGLTEKQEKQTSAEGIFTNISFVVTSAMRRVKEDEQGGFSKREIRQMIEGCGGTVVEDFTKISAGSEMFLIADTHYRTHKYLSALARSVPCVSHRWIRECVEKEELLDYKPYMLPAGISLLTNKLTPWHPSNNTLLDGKNIYIYTRNMIPDASVPNFVQIWSPLVAQMGATVVNEIPKDGLDILLTDATCPEDIIQQARRCNALVVSSEWIIQAIIEGSLPDSNAHERFRYDFVERPEGL